MSASGFTDQGALVHDNLEAGDFPVVQEKGTVITGQVLERGSLLGKIDASGKLNLSLSAAVDGSEAPFAVLAEDVDASAGDVEAIYYLSGEYNQDAMTFGAGHTASSTKSALRGLNIYLKTNVGA